MAKKRRWESNALDRANSLVGAGADIYDPTGVSRPCVVVCQTHDWVAALASADSVVGNLTVECACGRDDQGKCRGEKGEGGHHGGFLV